MTDDKVRFRWLVPWTTRL